MINRGRGWEPEPVGRKANGLELARRQRQKTINSSSKKYLKTQEAMMTTSYSGVKRDPFGNDDKVDEASEPLVVVKFDDAAGIITRVEKPKKTMMTTQPWRSMEGESMKDKQGFQSH